MDKNGKDILNYREGTAQFERFLKALDPDSVRLNDLGLKEWMKFAYDFAKHINFFDVNECDVPSGDWAAFFKDSTQIDGFIAGLTDSSDIPPHIALFVSFVKLLELTKNRFNKITARHLDFYYREILKFKRLGITPDKVHLIFELAKNVISEKIPEGTVLSAGKDANGKELIFKTTEELIANKIEVARLKSVYNDSEGSMIKAASVANSFDGMGGDFPEDEVKWWPFGYPGNNLPLSNNSDFTYPALPDAKIGFALASKIFRLKEGERNVSIAVEFVNSISGISDSTLSDNIEIYCTGEKGWLGPFGVKQMITDDDGSTVFSSGFDTATNRLNIAFQIPREEKAVTGYSAKVHGEHFKTGSPVCRILIKTGNKAGYGLYSDLSGKKVKKVLVKVDVRGVTGIEIENDAGKLSAAKPFYPFGTQPVKGSGFYIDYPELFEKSWTDFKVNIHWNNTPTGFKELYYAYRESYRYKISPNVFLEAMGSFVASEMKPKTQAGIGIVQPDKNARPAKKEKKTDKYVEAELAGKYNVGDFVRYLFAQDQRDRFIPEEKDLIVKDDDFFKADVELKIDEQWSVMQTLSLFTRSGDEFVTEFSVGDGSNAGSRGPVRLTLKQSFLQELFPRIYSLAMSSKNIDVVIPNEPYVPLAGTVSLNYSAEAVFDPENAATETSKEELLLFHEHPFGQSAEHPALTKNLEFLTVRQKNIFIVPSFEKGGELYIGLKNAGKLQQVSLLVQVMEGSENPLAESFAGNEKTEWSVLCDDRWMTLNFNDMIYDRTDNFLRSGIVKFNIPRNVTSDNSLLPAGFVWVRVSMNKRFDAVCKVLDIRAQVVTAEFVDDGNDTSHLEKGLKAKVISKLKKGIPGVKGVSQPFSSFGGKPAETDEKYYRRVSERLRHKNRAVTVWDYEHLILQQFPGIYKVKCLNHTKTEYVKGKRVISFLAPGNVTVVVVPDIVNKNVFDIYQPRVSKALLNSIQDFVNGLNTLHVTAKVINPVYEEVAVTVKVKFRKGYDEGYYLKVLNLDITKLLSPWAFENSAEINFGVVLHRSRVITYIEELEYVDFVEDVALSVNKNISLTKVAPSNPVAILVSAKEHDIKL